MAATLEGIDPAIAVDLADHDQITKARQRISAENAAIELKAKALEQIARLDHRISYLQRKAARLPIGNGKTKAARQITEAQELQRVLSEAIR